MHDACVYGMYFCILNKRDCATFSLDSVSTAIHNLRN